MIGNNTNKCFFTVISPGEAYVGCGKQELYDVLYNRLFAACEVFVVDTMEDANILALQWWPSHFYVNPMLQDLTPMSLPACGTYSQKDGRVLKQLGVQAQAELRSYPAFGISKPAPTPSQADNSVAKDTPNNINSGLIWSVDAMNAYTTAPDLNCLAHHLFDAGLVYPHARPFPDCDPEYALAMAAYAYVRRFYRRYESSKECVSPPTSLNDMHEGDIWKDIYFEDREAARVENPAMTRLANLGLL